MSNPEKAPPTYNARGIVWRNPDDAWQLDVAIVDGQIIVKLPSMLITHPSALEALDALTGPEEISR